MWLAVAFSAVLIGVGMGMNMSTPLQKDSWALLVAGSKGYNNYRHQADVSHAYHVMLAEGIPANRIIVMMYDDIAFHKENPTPGVIINRPFGRNVYEGLKIDYRRKDVNTKNFLSVLQGDKAAVKGVGTGRVIESDEDTNVFVYFSDHGGTGVLCFPHEVLSAVKLEQTLKMMHDRKLYNKLIMYIEACYSGSMFDNILEENTNVFVMTAAARDESSYGAYCGQGTCLGDEFSVRWMERMDSDNKGTFETFFHQYQNIRTAVKKSHVQIYGDFSVGTSAMTPNEDTEITTWIQEEEFFVDSKDIALYSLRYKLAISNDTATRKKAQMDLDLLIKGRRVVDELMEHLVYVATTDAPHLRSTVNNKRLGLSKSMFPCYMDLLAHFGTHCFGHEHEYLIHQYHKLANICVLQLATNLLPQMPAVCSPYKAAVKHTVL